MLHDETLDRVTGGAGRVREKMLDEVLSLDAGPTISRRFAGRKVLTPAEGLALVRGRVNLCLDCKDVDPASLAHEVLDAWMGKQVVVYGRPETLRALRAATLGLMTKWRPAFGPAEWVDEIRPSAVEIDASNVKPGFCRAFHARGIRVEAKVLGDYDRPEM